MTEQDEHVARLYARYAAEAYENARWEDFKSLEEKGLEYDPANPDLLYFKGMRLMNEKDYKGGLLCFERAWHSAESPRVVKGSDILGRLAEAGYTLGRHNLLVRLYHSVASLERSSPDLIFYTALALKSLGKVQEACLLAEEGLGRFQDQRCLILLASWVDEGPWKSVLAGSVERRGILYPDLLAREILKTRNPVLMASLYVERFNDVNSLYFRNRILDMPFLGKPSFAGRGRIWSLQVFLYWVKKNPEELLNRELYDVMRLDSTGDGLADLEIRKTSRGWSWKLDQDQDGREDYALQWNVEGDLRRLYSVSDYEQRLYNYYDYPFLDSVSIEGPGRSVREYLFFPGIHVLEIHPGNSGQSKASKEKGEGGSQGIMLSILENPEGFGIAEAGESHLLKSCFSIIESVRREELYTFREYTVAGGNILRFREDSNFDGCFDRRVILSNWLPVAGVRDLDGDGVEDFKEKYIHGRFAGFDYEGETDRLEEFQDLWNRQRFQLWDFSKDGFYDAFLKCSTQGVWEEYLLPSDRGD